MAKGSRKDTSGTPLSSSTLSPQSFSSQRRAGHPLHMSAPFWGSEPYAFPGPDSTASRPATSRDARGTTEQTGESDSRFDGLRGERGCTSMARIFAVLSALATIFLVSGAGSKF